MALSDTRAPGRIPSFVIRHPLPAFFALAVALPWVCAPIADGIFYSGLPTLLGIALALPFELLVASPAAAALVLTAVVGGRRGVAGLLRGFLRVRPGWRWYAVALALPPALVVLATPVPVSAAAALGVFALRLVNPWDGPGSEELGWRGFALPRLQDRFSALTANLILAFFVVVWHLRLVVTGDLPPVALIGTVAATILFGWIYANTGGSLLLVYLFHAADGVLKPSNLPLCVSFWCVLAIGVVLMTGRTLTRRRAS